MKKIVLVDDQKMFIDSLKEYFETQGDFEWKTFSDPEEALRYVLTTEDIYAVVSDYEMPQMDGLKLAQQVIEKRPMVKMVVMSAHFVVRLKRLALERGIDEKSVTFMDKMNALDLLEILR